MSDISLFVTKYLIKCTYYSVDNENIFVLQLTVFSPLQWIGLDWVSHP